MVEVIIYHPGHSHPLRSLTWLFNSPECNSKCSGCNQVFDEVSLFVFYCQEEGCEHYLHSWCAYLGYLDQRDYLDQIDHPLHPQHPLTLHFATSYPPPLPPNNNNSHNGRQTQTTDAFQHFVCSFCKQTRTSGFLLHCGPCNFYLDFACAKNFGGKKRLLSQYEVQHFFHKEHTLLPHLYSISVSDSSCQACDILINDGEPVLRCSASGCKHHYLHVGCFRVPEEMKHPLHPQHTLTLVPRSIIEVGEEEQRLRCIACHNLIEKGAFVLNCNQCPLGSFVLDTRCAFLNPTVKYDRHDHHLLAHYNHINVQDALCAACNTPCLLNLYRCFACNFNIHKACLSLPIFVNYEDHVHPFTLVNSLDEDQSGTYYCDVCEEKREPNHGLYSCQGCPSFVAHFECLLPPSYIKGHEPWMRQNFIHEDEDEELVPDGKQLVSQLYWKIEKMRNIVEAVLPAGLVLWKNIAPKLDELEESNAEAEGLIRQLRELINSINIAD